MERAKKGRERERIDKPHSHIHCTQLFTLGFFFISFDSYKSPIIFPRPFLLSFATVVGLAMRGGGEGEGTFPDGGGLTLLSAPSLRLIPDASCLPAVDRTCFALAPA